MANRPNDQRAPAKRRLRVPAALAVALVGTSATVAMSFAGCNSTTTPDPIDARPSNNLHVDAGHGIDGGGSGDGEADALVQMDAPGTPMDAPTPIDAPPDTPVA